MRVAAIGHTHHARIATATAPDGEPFVLVDCGAWIEECRETLTLAGTLRLGYSCFEPGGVACDKPPGWSGAPSSLPAR
jgi:hypothetical protein